MNSKAGRSIAIGIITVALSLMLTGSISWASQPAEDRVEANDVALQANADVVVHVHDFPPRYADDTTALPVSVVLSGQSVLWQWEGGAFHSVTTDATLSVGSEGFDSGTQRLDENGDPFSFEQTFTQPGVYKVFCQVHPSQHGVVVVV